MCGRFALGIPKKLLEEILGAELPGGYREQFNIAPGAPIPVLGFSGPEMKVWGTEPRWSGRGKGPRRIINARAETLFEKPMFRNSALRARCLVPAQAFYEWQAGPSGKIPHAFTMKEDPLFTMAGILVPVPQSDETAAVVMTCPANATVAPVHHRMPVIIPPESRGAWLDPEAKEAALRPLLVPLPSGEMHGYPVSPKVNSPANDTPACLDPVPAAPARPNLLDF